MSIEIFLELSGVCQYPNGTKFNYRESEVFSGNSDARKYLTNDPYDDITVDIATARACVKEYCHEEFDRLVALAQSSGMDIIAVISSRDIA